MGIMKVCTAVFPMKLVSLVALPLSLLDENVSDKWQRFLQVVGLSFTQATVSREHKTLTQPLAWPHRSSASH